MPPLDQEHDAFRSIPPVNDVVASSVLNSWRERESRAVIVEAAQAVLADHRATIGRDTSDGPNGTNAPVTASDLAERVAHRLEACARPPLTSVINATGIIIHTGLGRAPLAEAAVQALADVARGYAPVELEMDSGERGRRSTIVRDLLCRLTGAEAATVVNNNAAALVLVLATFAKGRTAVVSRGELIEIGGSFRLPDVMATGGAILREVGTTNKTRRRDFERVIDDSTGVLLKVHPSNYRIDGFTQEVSIAELAQIGANAGVPVVHDIGSGALVDLSRLGVDDEPSARDSIEAGADLVLFSGDKLLGGPQAGIIVGRRDLVEQLERHPLMRAVRLDKLILGALAVTLQLHRDPEHAARRIPVLAMIGTPVAELEERGRALVTRLLECPGVESAELEPCTAYVGGGSLPTHGIPSIAVKLRATGMTEGDLAAHLRRGHAAVLARVQSGSVLLDLRTVFADQDDALAKAVGIAVASGV